MKKPLLHSHAGTYRGFVVMYRNVFCGFLGACRILPRFAVVVEVSGKGNGRRMRVPVNTGISFHNPNVVLGAGEGLLFKLVRIFV